MLQPLEFLAIGSFLAAGTAVLRPIAKGIAARLTAGAPRADDARVRELEAELRLNRQALIDTRDEVARMSEKVAFLEKLLEQPAGMGELPPGRR